MTTGPSLCAAPDRRAALPLRAQAAAAPQRRRARWRWCTHAARAGARVCAYVDAATLAALVCTCTAFREWAHYTSRTLSLQLLYALQRNEPRPAVRGRARARLPPGSPHTGWSTASRPSSRARSCACCPRCSRSTCATRRTPTTRTRSQCAWSRASVGQGPRHGAQRHLRGPRLRRPRAHAGAAARPRERRRPRVRTRTTCRAALRTRTGARCPCS